MDLEKAYNKIDNLCCLNYDTSQIVNKCFKQLFREGKLVKPIEVDFFEGYKYSQDDDFCKNANEMVDALETIKELVNLHKEFGCPLDIVLKIKFGDIHHVYDENGDRFFINGGEIFKSQFSAYRRIQHSETDFDFVDQVFKWEDYGKTWWTKEDRGE